MRFNWREYPAAVKIIFGIYSIGFLGGTHTHVAGILQQGCLSMAPKAPLLLNIYWDALTLFDPLAVCLLWSRPEIGIGLAVAIMLTDILINAYSYAAGYFGLPVPGMIPIWLFIQSLFATFLFVTAPIVVAKLQEQKRSIKNIKE